MPEPCAESRTRQCSSDSASLRQIGCSELRWPLPKAKGMSVRFAWKKVQEAQICAAHATRRLADMSRRVTRVCVFMTVERQLKFDFVWTVCAGDIGQCLQGHVLCCTCYQMLGSIHDTWSRLRQCTSSSLQTASLDQELHLNYALLHKASIISSSSSRGEDTLKLFRVQVEVPFEVPVLY